MKEQIDKYLKSKEVVQEALRRVDHDRRNLMQVIIHKGELDLLRLDEAKLARYYRSVT